jgi:hypothetical protein
MEVIGSNQTSAFNTKVTHPHEYNNYEQKGVRSYRRWWVTLITLATWKAEIRRTAAGGQPRQKALQTSSQPTAGHSWCMSVIPAMAGNIKRSIV